ncbi:MAG: DUF3108 domain-containing protein [Candidatus Omnitrophota bacterium]
MRLKIIIIVILLFLISGCTMIRETIPDREIRVIEDVLPYLESLRVGERLVYQVKMWGVEIGECITEVKELVKIGEHEAYHLVFTARTNAFFSFFYKIDDTIDTYIEKETFYPIKSEIIISQSTKSSSQIVIFDQKNNRLKSHGIRNEKNKINIDREIPPAAFDAVSCFYKFRTKRINLYEPVKFNVSTPKKDWEVAMRVLKRGKISVPLGNYGTFLVQPVARLLKDNKLFKRVRVLIWFSTDTNRVPVLIKGYSFFGNPVAYLRKIN